MKLKYDRFFEILPQSKLKFDTYLKLILGPPQPGLNMTDYRIGVDWRSMMHPASLPLTNTKPINMADVEGNKYVDYHALKYKMESQVIFDDFENANEIEIGHYNDNVYMDKMELFYELINQRLSQV